jgi:hypothetical protein
MAGMKANLKVKEFRDLISLVSDMQVSLASCATANEQRSESIRLANAIGQLKSAVCSRANQYDREKAARVLANSEEALAKKTADFKAADSLWTRLAFAGDWR